jgi:3',5'-cyclic AMP phosphodiesterase CpdA
MKQLLATLILAWSCLAGYAQPPVLKFNADGKFKIVQLTDIHYLYGDPKSDIAVECIQKVLDIEKPDLVIATGDVICCGKPADKSMHTVVKTIAEKKTPFVILFGNHDDESGLSRTELLEIIRSYPYNLTYSAEGISGVGNCLFTLADRNGKNAFALYCFDSNAYSQISDEKGYDYIRFDQIQWYREHSAALTAQNGGTPLPSLAFFHIPLIEYSLAATDETVALIGTRREKACPPNLNSGLFAAMKEMGDVKATFVGHDHDNDYAALYKGILLTYGRFSGANTTYNALKPNGCRVIELTEGEKGFKTWIRLTDRSVHHPIHYPSDFGK